MSASDEQTEQLSALSPEMIETIRDAEDADLGVDWADEGSSSREAIVEKLAWIGRLTVFAAESGVGKSTLAGAAVAAVTKGLSLFGEEETSQEQGRPVLYLSLEEHRDDLLSRLNDFQANMYNVVMNHYPSGSALESLIRTAKRVEPSLIVIDSLTALAKRSDIQPSGADGWGDVMTPLVDLAHQLDIAVLALHHGKKSDGRCRGHSVIADAADVLLEAFREDEESVCRIECRRARWPVEDYTIELEDDEQPYSYRIVDEEN